MQDNATRLETEKKIMKKIMEFIQSPGKLPFLQKIPAPLTM